MGGWAVGVGPLLWFITQLKWQTMVWTVRQAGRKGRSCVLFVTRNLGSAKRRRQQAGETGLDEGQAGQQTTGETRRRGDDEMEEEKAGGGLIGHPWCPACGL